MRMNRFTAGEPVIRDPQRLDAETLDTQPWDEDVDVLVVGMGGAGLSAAIEAREAGCEVLITERFMGGGSTRISGGIVYAGGGTDIQAEAGIEDSPENMFRYLRQEVGDAVSETTLRDFCENSAEELRWLSERGVPFEASLCPEKTSYPSNRYYFYYSGNEAFPPYSDEATPAPRGHRAKAPGVSGAALFQPLKAWAERLGVRMATRVCIDQLVTDDAGRVVGAAGRRLMPGTPTAWCHRQLFSLMVFLRYATIFTPFVNHALRWLIERLETRGRPFRVRARRGVVLAAGGFYANRRLVARYAPEYRKGTPLGTIADNGSGILLGRSVGGATDHMDSVSAWRFINPPEAFARGVLVNRHGERICNEMLYGAQMGERIVKTHDGTAFLLIDRALWRQAHRQLGPSRAMWFQSVTALMYLWLERRKARTWRELARKIGVPPDTLEATVSAYNALAPEDADPMDKPAEHRARLTQPPFYALNCSYDARFVPCPSLTLGGLRVDERTGAVQDASGQSIAGLYAAGRTAVGVASRSYVSGLSIADCVYAGRRAGRAVCREQP